MTFRMFLLIATASLLSACATSRGFNREQLRAEMNGTATVTDKEIQRTLAAKAQLPKPFKLGVYFKEPADGSRGQDWHWSDEDKKKILSVKEQLKNNGEASEVFAISDATVNGTDLKSIRQAAARHGADAVMVVSGINDLDEYFNKWAWTYFLVLPGFFVPASVTDSLFMARATMWDVRNEFLYMTADAESLYSETKPAAFTTERVVMQIAKDGAVQELQEQITKTMADLVEKQRVTR